MYTYACVFQQVGKEERKSRATQRCFTQQKKFGEILGSM